MSEFFRCENLECKECFTVHDNCCPKCGCRNFIVTSFIDEVLSYQGHFPALCQTPLFMALEMVTETAEASEKIKKLVRLHGDDVRADELSADERKGVAGELGDSLCCIAKMLYWLGMTEFEVQKIFLEKMRSRIARNVQLGSGDNR